jgi:ribonuclease PH
MTDEVAAVSCGIYKGQAVLDLDYAEDSSAEADSNFVMTAKGLIVEVQTTAEEHPFEENQLIAMMGLAKAGIAELAAKQRAALGLD